MSALRLWPFIIGCVAVFDTTSGPIGWGLSVEEAKANLIVIIAHGEPTNLKEALGELANIVDVRRAIEHAHKLRCRCESKASEYPLHHKQLKYQRAADHWRKVIGRLNALAVGLEKTP